MRYYAIKLMNPSYPGTVIFDPSAGAFVTNILAPYTWGSHDYYGVLMPGALNVELDVISQPYAAFQGNIHLKVWGVGLPELSQASNLAGYSVEVSAGMVAPYNLNVAAKAGTIVSGQVFQCYGNWEGVNQSLDLIIVNSGIQPDQDADIPFSWPSGTPITDAITASLEAAFHGYTVTGQKNVKYITTRWRAGRPL